MQKIFDEVNSLDKRCYEKFLLSEDLLMEHAASSMASYISEKHSSCTSILIVCGSGNNGADGITLARLLYTKFNVKLFLASTHKSAMAEIQLKRVEALGLEIVDALSPADIIVDCLFGTGLNKPLNEDSINIINTLNSYDSIKIACDIPSGINNIGQVESIAFEADITITMGALKTSLFTDLSKLTRSQDVCAKIRINSIKVFSNLFIIYFTYQTYIQLSAQRNCSWNHSPYCFL